MKKLQLRPWIPRHKRFEPSGLAATADGTLLVVGDEGQLGRLAPGDRALSLEKVRPRGDLEGVTIDAAGRVLVLAERRSELWHVDAGRRVQAWALPPPEAKRDTYEGLTARPDGHLVLSTQAKRSALRIVAPLTDGAGRTQLVAEQRLDIPDVAGLAMDGDHLLALSDKACRLVRLRWDGATYVPVDAWKTPERDLEGVVVVGPHIVLAQDSGGLWRGPWPQ